MAEQRHDVAVVDEQGRLLARRRVAVAVSGFSELTEILANLPADRTRSPQRT
jgi:hypothetical protein